jgi:hypothetical protein
LRQPQAQIQSVKQEKDGAFKKIRITGMIFWLFNKEIFDNHQT